MFDAIIYESKRSCRLGTRKVTPEGFVYKYVKIGFGLIGKENGKNIRDVRYAWILTETLK